MKRTIALFFLASNFLSAQVKGLVVDQSDRPIPYVNIWIENESIGTTAEEDGTYTLTLKNQDKNLIFSAIGYKKLIAPFQEKIVLEKEIYKLDEVVISNLKQTKELEIGGSKKIHYSHLSGSLPWIYAKFFPYKEVYKETPFVKSVVVFTKSAIKKATFKIHLYSIGEDGKPSNDIVDEDIIVTVKSGLKENRIDISKYKVQISKEGICIGYEWMIIESNKYNFEYKDLDKSKRTYTTYAPSVICNDVEVDHTFHFSGGKWFKRTISSNNKIAEPAINLVLTN